jgi:hypothetical protein
MRPNRAQDCEYMLGNCMRSCWSSVATARDSRILLCRSPRQYKKLHPYLIQVEERSSSYIRLMEYTNEGAFHAIISVCLLFRARQVYRQTTLLVAPSHRDAPTLSHHPSSAHWNSQYLEYGCSKYLLFHQISNNDKVAELVMALDSSDSKLSFSAR